MCTKLYCMFLILIISVIGICLPSHAQYMQEGPIAPSPEPTFANTSKWTIELDGALTTAYWFRGISQRRQNTNGVIIQGYTYVGLEVYESDFLNAAAHVASWNDFTTVEREGDGGWYESDPTLGVTFFFNELNLAVDLSYLWLVNVAGGEEFDQEIDLLAEYNDGPFWNQLFENTIGMTIPGFDGFKPHILFAFETSGAADEVGNGGGIYFEFGIDPAIQILPPDILEVELSFPTRIGLSIHNYFQPRAGSSGDLFGFFEAGFQVATPLNGIGPEYGKWTLYGRFDLLLLSDQLRELSRGMNTSDDSLQFIGTVGLNAIF